MDKLITLFGKYYESILLGQKYYSDIIETLYFCPAYNTYIIEFKDYNNNLSYSIINENMASFWML